MNSNIQTYLRSLQGKSIPSFTKSLDIGIPLLRVKKELEQIEVRLKNQIQSFDPELVGYAEYVCINHGKRIRPALTLLAAEALTGKSTEEHLDLGLIIELVHMASLVHDDILDGAQKRRNKITAFAKWGTEIAVLLGDSLFSHALVLCTRLSHQEASKKIAEAANEVCNGEIIQTQRRFDLNFSIDDYYRVIRMKTAALFRISTELAGVVSNSSETMTGALRQYGESLGIAYQIYDDCLDLIGVENATGKTLGTDLGKGKLTLPLLHVLKQLQGNELHQVREIILEGTPEDRKQLIGLIIDRGGLQHSIRQTLEEIKRGTEALEVLPLNDARKALQRIPEALSEHLKGITV